jgi:hypothetical protein
VAAALPMLEECVLDGLSGGALASAGEVSIALAGATESSSSPENRSSGSGPLQANR